MKGGGTESCEGGKDGVLTSQASLGRGARAGRAVCPFQSASGGRGETRGGGGG